MINLKRITFEIDDLFAKKFSDYCEESNISKKSAIVNLLLKEMDTGMMKQYINTNTNENPIDFINEKNYERLYNLKMENDEPWDMNEYLDVNEKINYYFEKDETLTSILFFANESKIEDLSFPNGLLDHYYHVKFNNKDMNYDFEHLSGVISFPYTTFEELGEIISSWNTKFWKLYIINPALMKYAEGSLGLFITPMSFEIAIADYNGLFETLTGYKLFYLWADKDSIKPIMQNKELKDDSEWFESLTDEEFPKMHRKIVKFWYDNKEKIKCFSLENSYFQFTHKMQHDLPPLMSLTLQGSDFEMFDTITGWTTGKCNRIEFDLKSFKCIYVDRREIVFTDRMLKNFKDGNFELKMI